MTNKEFQALVSKNILDSMPGYAVTGHLLFENPLGEILRGFCFEGSSFDKTTFTLWAFVQPLYVPRSYVYFTFGIRPGMVSGVGPSWWTLTEQNERDVIVDILLFITEEGDRFIDTWHSPQDFVEKANPLCPDSTNHSVLETAMYSAVLIDRSAAAYQAFERLRAVLEGDDRFESVEWLRQTLGRATFLLDTYRRGHDAAVALLSRWRAETLRDLRLTKFADPPPISLA